MVCLFYAIIFILDIVTGNVIAEVFQAGWTAPVNMVFAENAVIAHSYVPKTIRMSSEITLLKIRI